MVHRKFENIQNVAFAVAALALATPAAHAQTNRVYNAATGKYTTTAKSRIYSGTRAAVNNGANTATNGYLGGAYAGYLSNYAPYVYGSMPYLYGAPYPYAPGGALVLGSDGSVYNPFAGNGPVNPAYSQNNVTIPAPIQYSDQIEAVRLPNNRVQIVWDGDPRPVASMKFSLLDRNRATLTTEVVTDLPAQATFVRPSNAVYYRVVILYGDGATRSIVAAL